MFLWKQNTLIMDIENGTWVQLKSNTSKVYRVCCSSAFNKFLDCVSPQNERKLLPVEDIEIITDVERVADLELNNPSTSS